MNLPINNLKLLIKILADVSIVFISLYLAIIINAERLLPLSKSYIALGLIIISLQITILYFFNTYSEFTKFFDYENILKILISLFFNFFIFNNNKFFCN